MIYEGSLLFKTAKFLENCAINKSIVILESCWLLNMSISLIEKGDFYFSLGSGMM